MLLDPGPGFLEIAVSFQVRPYPPGPMEIVRDECVNSFTRRAILTAANEPNSPLEWGV